MAKATLTQRFIEAWREYAPGMPEPEREVRFHPTRRWRFDFGFQAMKLAIEIDGGIFVRGRHSRGVGQAMDNDKMNCAVVMGWRILRFSTKQLEDPQMCVEQILEALGVFEAQQ